MKDTMLDVVLKNALKISMAAMVLGLFGYIMLPFLIPIALGGILAMALLPLVDFLRRRGFSRNRSLLILSLSLLFCVVAPVIAFFVRGAQIMNEFMHKSSFSSLTGKANKWAYALIDSMSKDYGFNNIMAKAKFDQMLVGLTAYASGVFSQIASELPTIALVGFVTVISMYCFLKEAETIRLLFDRYFYFQNERGSRFVEVIKVSCREVFVSNLLTGVIQATVVAVGSLIFDVGDFFLIFFLTFVLSFIPILGAGPVAAVLSLVAFVDGRAGAGAGMIVIACVAGLSDNLIRPYLATLGNVEVHPFISLLAVIGGVIMFGLPGLFIGPLAASLCFGAVPLIIDEYFLEEAELEAETKIQITTRDAEISIEH